MQGNYPVVREDAAQMCALQMQAESGPTMLSEDGEGLESSLERYIVKQVGLCKLRLLRIPVALGSEADFTCMCGHALQDLDYGAGMSYCSIMSVSSGSVTKACD